MAVGTVQRNGQRPDGSQTALSTTNDPRYQKLRSVLEMSKTQIGQIVSRMISVDELVRLTLNAACKTPDLLKCMDDPRGVASIGLSLMKAAAMNLRPDGRNGHLLPFQNKDGWMECQFFPDYKGLTKLMCMSSKVATVNGSSVRENDQFDFEFGSREFIRFKPAMKDRGELIAAFAYYTTPTGQTCFRVLMAEDVIKRRAMSKSFNGRYPQYSPWSQWPDSMWAKSALHDLAKIAPLGEAFDRAMAIEELDEAGALTEGDIRAMSHNSAKVIEHQPTETAFEEPIPEQRGEPEPVYTKSQGKRQEVPQETYSTDVPFGGRLPGDD